ncbi:hypothetical protein FQA47_022098 [Oryzias melastigma]|uniref:Uncharacterized protein n=1 Tax=Oryzias melastigma TaxID=30732 RepID=A0A834F4P5_ORYME|nr:hypothetical protein FQA47_022098 [Oryzias melastigma]
MTDILTCRAELQQFNQTRSAQILITAVFLWSIYHIIAVCVVEGLLFLSAFALWQLFGMKCHRPDPPNVSSMNSISPAFHLGNKTRRAKRGANKRREVTPSLNTKAGGWAIVSKTQTTQ